MRIEPRCLPSVWICVLAALMITPAVAQALVPPAPAPQTASLSTEKVIFPAVGDSEQETAPSSPETAPFASDEGNKQDVAPHPPAKTYEPIPPAPPSDPAAAPAACPQSLPTAGPAMMTIHGPPPVQPVTANVCPYCGQSDCPRMTHDDGCCEAIRSALFMHFCFGAPGYVHTPVPPPGARLHALLARQVANGQAALQVLYHYDFLKESPLLSVRGHRQLRKIIGRALRTGFPIVIESTPYHPELARARWEQVVAELARIGTPIPPARVIIAGPPNRPAQSDELPLIYKGFLGQAAPALPTGAAAGGGAGTGRTLGSAASQRPGRMTN